MPAIAMISVEPVGRPENVVRDVAEAVANKGESS